MGNQTSHSYSVSKTPVKYSNNDIIIKPEISLRLKEDIDQCITYIDQKHPHTKLLYNRDARHACIQILQEIKEKKINQSDEWSKYKHISFILDGVHILRLTSSDDDDNLLYTIHTVKNS